MRSGSLRMFGRSNIGQVSLCNLGAYGFGNDGHGTWGGLSDDSTMLIHNWYARDNLASNCTREFREAWDAWAQVTSVSFAVGQRTAAVLPLRDLLLRREGQLYGDGVIAADVEVLEVVAMELYRRYMLHESSLEEIPEWSTAEKARWCGVAMQAYSATCPPSAIAGVHPRLPFGVNIETDGRALGALLEIMPSPAPQSLVWIHLEGLFSQHST